MLNWNFCVSGMGVGRHSRLLFAFLKIILIASKKLNQESSRTAGGQALGDRGKLEASGPDLIGLQEVKLTGLGF